MILHFALFFSPSCRQAHVLGILAGMDQMDSYVAVVPMVQTAVDFGFSAVAVHQGRRHFLRGAQADSHGPCDH